MIRKAATKKNIACFFLGILTLEALLPLRSLALTSGPKQPETSQFTAAGTSDMVDLSTGDFKYNIPLIDVDGYPVNLNYASGISMDDEASWVGLGWNLNVGAINRSMRGIADDASGEEVAVESYMKPRITVGGKVTGRVELTGNSLGLSGSGSVSIFSDNYTGYGADVGIGMGISQSVAMGGSQTAGLKAGARISMNSNTQDGVGVNPSLSLSVKQQMSDVQSVSAGLSANLGYNTREGLKSTTLGASFDYSDGMDDVDDLSTKITATGSTGYSTSYSNTSYNTPPFYPRTTTAFKTKSNSYGFDIGGSTWLLYLGGGLTGYKTVREVLQPVTKTKAYGFMYAEAGKQDKDALMDFMREKDNPVVPNLPNLAIPIATPDLFTYSGQAGSGQFRLYRGNTGTFADAFTEDKTESGSLFTEYGFGTYFHGGASYAQQNVSNKTGKWRTKNDFLAKGDYPRLDALGEEQAYFKMVGEKNMDDPTFNTRIHKDELVRVALNGRQLTDQLVKGNDPYNNQVTTSPLRKKGRQLRRSPILALTAEEAEFAGLDKQIKSYPFNQHLAFTPPPCNQPEVIPFNRNDTKQGKKKPHHLSEITVQGDNGSRMVYGLPVYNNFQEEYTFSVEGAPTDPNDKNANLVPYQKQNGKIKHKHDKTDQYYRKETQPSYATAHLLTAVLSPDYVDLADDGITDDDPGTAVKFNYSKLGDYKWRTPFAADKAQYNKGLYADDSDDKGNIVYGEKEIWYLHSIESKTKIAYFITADRLDALGVTSEHGGINTALKQKCLKEIRIYSKADLTVPIKKVVFDYGYTLCPGTPNSIAPGSQGKLTLNRVHFEYNNSDKGKYHPYIFTYGENKPYSFLSSDRWGTYKGIADNANINEGFPELKNDEFPYTDRSALADENAKAWHLSKIELPSGGDILVDYESDDYSYVQDRKAMQMTRIEGLITNTNGDPALNLRDAQGFKFKLTEAPEGVPADETLRRNWFIRNYLGGKPYIYAKLFTNVSDHPLSDSDEYYDYVPGYAEISTVKFDPSDSKVVYLLFKTADVGNITANPFSFAAWQKMRLEYPRYAYPGFKNRINDDRPVAAAVSALANAIGNFSELRMNFNKRAVKKHFAEAIKKEKSFLRIAAPSAGKNGGGVRVSKIRITDNWDQMAENAAGATYGQSYDYRMMEEGKLVSSGVATYEPSIGGDENPMRMPLPYSQENMWSLSNAFYLEEPMAESVFPAPQVGYRKVTVSNLAANGQVSNAMGSTVSEFYTAKEFPVVVAQTNAEKAESETKRWFPFFGSDYAHELYMSQGYVIYLNDMHGKPFREITRNKAGEEIASVEYIYNTYDDGGRLRLNNADIPYLAESHKVQGGWMAREVELFADMREQETGNINKVYEAGVDVIPTFLGFPTPFPHIPVTRDNDYRLFRSASVLKTVADYGVVREVIKTVNGSTIRTTNLCFDQETGEVLLTKTQNEFEDPIYTLNVPAYYVHEGMGMAYKTLNMVLTDFRVGEQRGEISSIYEGILAPGDELVDGDGRRTWVIRSSINGSAPRLRLVDIGGRVENNYTAAKVKVCRSGYRNLLTASGASFVTLKDPRGEGGTGDLYKFFSGVNTEEFPMLDAKAALYHEAWGKPASCVNNSCPEGYVDAGDGLGCVLRARPTLLSSVVTGDTYWGYGDHGVRLYKTYAVNDNAGQYFDLRDNYWMGASTSRLWQAGVKMPGVPNNTWWGLEACFTAPVAGVYYLGFASDNFGHYYIDGQLKASQVVLQAESSLWWRVIKVDLTAGKHTVRIDAANGGNGSGPIDNPQAVAVEIYQATEDEMRAGSYSLNNKRIFSTEWLRNNPNVSCFRLSTAPFGVKSQESFTCKAGQTLNICDGTPNCGYKLKGDCPDGYRKSADGMACIPTRDNDDLDSNLNIRSVTDNNFYDKDGAILYDDNYSPLVMTSRFWGGGGNVDCTPPPDPENPGAPVTPRVCGRLNKSGVSLPAGTNQGLGKWSGVEDCFRVFEGQERFYVGFSANCEIKIFFDDTIFQHKTLTGAQWQIYPKVLTPGNHKLRIETRSASSAPQVWGLETYHVTRQDLISATDETIYGGWTSDWMYNHPHGHPYNSFVKDDTYGDIIKAKYKCAGQLYNICTQTCDTIPNGAVLNPYYTGFLGNWAVWKEYAYLDAKPDNGVFNPSVKDLGIRQAGAYVLKKPFYEKQSNGVYKTREHTGVVPGWVVVREATMQDRTAQELESKDALNRYTSARFGFRNVLPVAVASNARHREIFYDGFEDYKFYNNCMAKPNCDVGEFDIRKALGASYATRLDASDAHSGKYSLKLSSPITLKTWQFNNEHMPGIYLSNNPNGEFYRAVTPWLGLWGFAPMDGKRYVFSAWIKDGDRLSTSNGGIQLSLNGSPVPLPDQPVRKATVEGWKLVEGIIETPPPNADGLTEIALTISGPSNLKIDDIRIFPFDAQIKTFSYDDITLRLMGEMDENNYATFYEYDNEGSLTRVKKETERGIITIKESKTGYKKKAL